MYKLIKPLLFQMDPEEAHGKTIDALKICQKYPLSLSMVRRMFTYENPVLSQQIHGITFNNPVGLAAGFDKSCEVPKALEMAGFGSLELGGITPLPQPGIVKPRMYRLPEDNAIINRMGFNNIGMNKALSNLRKFSYDIPVGINVGVNKVTSYDERYTDYIKVIDTFKHDATFFTINISSPNTANLQNFHNKDEFAALSQAIEDYKSQHDLNAPIFIKLTSDIELEDFKQILEPITQTFDGLILANTTQKRENLNSPNREQSGGLSGRPLFERNLELVKWAYQQTKGKMLIIATGGIFTTDDVIAMMRNGASLVQIYSALIYQGPGLTKSLNKDLAQYLKENGFEHISEIIGLDAINN